jgi:hypothetical protein
VRWLIGLGLNNCQISRITGVSRPTIRDWRNRPRSWPRETSGGLRASLCPRCDGRDFDEAAYAWLLGLYLGDGYIVAAPRDVYRLRVFCDQRYVRLIDECRELMSSVRGGGRRPGFVTRQGCVEIYSYWKHWPCLFPQHGPGPKHARRIRLEEWQVAIVVEWPHLFLRGLINSDGCRVLNWVNGTPYSRYLFSNRSTDIRNLFGWACDLYGVRWRHSNRFIISVARRADVARLDAVIGPKS